MCTSRIFIIFARKKTRKTELDAEQVKSEAKQVNSFYVLFLNKKTVNGNLSASFMMSGRHREDEGVLDFGHPSFLFPL